MDALIFSVAGVLVVIAFITLSNVMLFPRLRLSTPTALPRVSVLVPARNEAAVIGETLQLLSTQDYPDYEILVLDDGSTDGTADVARRVGVGVINGAPLPAGWTGKNWACRQLADRATGNVLLFTDADVCWQQGALSAVIDGMQRTGADLFTVWPTQITVTWAERLTVPLIALVVLGYLPVVAVHHVPLSVFGAANGQCMAWQRAAYQRVDGHEAVRDSVLEDVGLGRHVKRLGLRLRMADGAGLVACHMYDNWAGVRRGFAKNILAGYGGVAPLLLATAFHWLVFVFPLSLVLVPAYAATGMALFILGITIRALTAIASRQRISDAALMPLSAFLMTLIAGQSIYWRLRFGGPQWKGRTLVTGGMQDSGERASL